MEEDNKVEKEQFVKLNFFKKVWYSVTKFEKYPEMAALGVRKALSYFTILMAIFSILYTGIYVYYVANIAEFEQDNLNLSQKIVSGLIVNDEESDINQITEILGNYSTEVMIFSLFISIFITFYTTTLIDVLTLSIFGLLTCLFAKIKMNYKAVFNMSIFALTLSIILRIIYFALNMLLSFEIKYFDVMYIAVSYISLAAAIFLIKSDVIKQHLELMRILEESKEKNENTITVPEKPKEDEEEKKENKEKKEKKKENDEKPEGQGSNA